MKYIAATAIAFSMTTSLFAQDFVVRVTHDAGVEVAPWEPVTYTVEIEYPDGIGILVSAQIEVLGIGLQGSLQSEQIKASFGLQFEGAGTSGGAATDGLDFAPFSFYNPLLGSPLLDNPLPLGTFTLAAGLGDLDVRLALVPSPSGEVMSYGTNAFSTESVMPEQVEIILPDPIRVVGQTEGDTTLAAINAEFSDGITNYLVVSHGISPDGEIVLGGRATFSDSKFLRWDGTQWEKFIVPIKGDGSKIHRASDSLLITGRASDTSMLRLTRYQNGQVVTLAGWAGASVKDITQSPSGVTYLAGLDFTLVGGVQSELARHRLGMGIEPLPLAGGGVWTPTDVDSIDVLPDGRLVVAINNSNSSGGVVVYDGSSVVTLGGVGSPVGGCRSVVVSTDGDVYVSCDGVLNRWDGLSWSEIGSGILAIEALPDGRVFGVLETDPSMNDVPVLLGDDGIEVHGIPTRSQHLVVDWSDLAVGPAGEMIIPSRTPGSLEWTTSWSIAEVVMSPLPPDCFIVDMNGDTYIDGSDLTHFVGLYLSGDAQADMNQDGYLDNADIITLVRLYLSACL